MSKAKSSSTKKSKSSKTTAPKKKTATKSAVKKTAPKLKIEESVTEVPTISSPKSTNTDVISVNKKVVIITAGILLAFGIAGAYFYQKHQVVATVNGTPISRTEYIAMLESQGGEQILDRLVTETLIKDAAAEANVTVGTEEIDQEIDQARSDLEAQGQDFDQLLLAQGITEAELRDQIRIQALLNKLAGVEEEATVEEVDAYLEDNADYLPEDMEEAELRSLAEQQVVSQNKQEKIQTFLSDLRAKANIVYSNK